MLRSGRAQALHDRALRVRRAGAEYVLGLGDGFADRCLVQFADRTFARQDSYLQRYCDERGLPYTPFTEMYEAADAVRRHGNC